MSAQAFAISELILLIIVLTHSKWGLCTAEVLKLLQQKTTCTGTILSRYLNIAIAPRQIPALPIEAHYELTSTQYIRSISHPLMIRKNQRYHRKTFDNLRQVFMYSTQLELAIPSMISKHITHLVHGCSLRCWKTSHDAKVTSVVSFATDHQHR